MRTKSFVQAVYTFQESYHDDCEYGISDEDAAKGLAAVFARTPVEGALLIEHFNKFAKRRDRLVHSRIMRKQREYLAGLSPAQRLARDAQGNLSPLWDIQFKVLKNAYISSLGNI